MRGLLPRLGWSAGAAITEALAKLGEAEPAREDLFRQLEHQDEGERAAALSAMVHLDEIPESLVPAVVACLDNKGDPRNHAQFILKRMTEGPRRASVWPSLLALAEHPDSDVAVWALELLGAHPDEAEAALRSCLRDERAAVRVEALEALAGIHNLTDEFLRLAGDRDPRVRQAAALRLGDTGPMSPGIAVAIRNLLRSRVADVREAAVRAVAIRGPVTCGASSLVARLARNDPSERIRERAIDCVPECGLSPAAAVSLLRPLPERGRRGRPASRRRLCPGDHRGATRRARGRSRRAARADRPAVARRGRCAPSPGLALTPCRDWLRPWPHGTAEPARHWG